MKTTLKKVNRHVGHLEKYTPDTVQGLNINNTQFALLEASEDFMVTALALFSGVVTDRIGGVSKSSKSLNILGN
jgi:hypothetical protein